MSVNTIPISELVSEDWQLAGEDTKRPPTLIVQLRRRTYILPWFQFAHAEGDNSFVKIAFASHLVTVSGHGLAALLAALATQSVVRLVQPGENEAKFGFRGSASTKCTGPSIEVITVEKNGEDP